MDTTYIQNELTICTTFAFINTAYIKYVDNTRYIDFYVLMVIIQTNQIHSTKM